MALVDNYDIHKLLTYWAGEGGGCLLLVLRLLWFSGTEQIQYSPLSPVLDTSTPQRKGFSHSYILQNINPEPRTLNISKADGPDVVTDFLLAIQTI